MLSSKDGKMIILSSPSGAVKTTLVKKISKEKNYNISISGSDFVEISDSEAEKILTVGDAIKFIESKAN